MTHWGNSFPGNETFPSTPAAEDGEIPEDVRETAANALNVADDMTGALFCERVEIIASAILAERKRCAGIATDECNRRLENVGGYPAARVHDFLVVGRAIERRIRNGGAA